MSTIASPTYPGAKIQDAIAAIHAAIDLGINLFDTAPAYGNGASEELLAQALRGRRDRVLIADKVLTPSLTPDDVRRECELSLQRLGTDRIDLYQIHWPASAAERASINETLIAMQGLIKAGKVRAIGVCNFGQLDLAEAINTGIPLATNQVPYSLLVRAVEYEVRDICEKHGIGILCYSPLAQGLLTGKFASPDDVPDSRARTRLFAGSRSLATHGEPGFEEDAFIAIASIRRISSRLNCSMAELALAWLLHQPAVAGVITGASSANQVQRNIAAAEIALSPADLEELNQITHPVKDALGSNLDMWQSKSRIR